MIPKLNVSFSEQFEVERVLYTIEKLDWYKDHQYNPRLPEAAQIPNNLSRKEIMEIVSKEFDSNAFEKEKRYLLDNWHGVFENCRDELGKILPFLQREYDVQLTVYGMGGSYDYPNKIIANIKSWYAKGLLHDILHEMIHLSIHPLIEGYNVRHWTKERIVDLLERNLSPSYAVVQKYREDMTWVDPVVAKYFPDTQKIVSSLANK